MTLVDPLAALPDPADDRTLLRTFPGAPSHGQIAWESVGPDRWRFTTSLPRRYGDLGWTREGLMANGGWYPQPVRPDDPLPVFEWTVTLNLPADASGAVGNVAGTDQLLWRGVTERVSIGVLRRGRITRLEGGQWTVDLISSLAGDSQCREVSGILD